MQRVVSIHLNGNVYQIEENGYNALFGFLDSTETALQNDADRAQKLADLERVLAERCQACLSPHKSVVTSVEIDRILVELGHAAPAAAPASSSSSSSSSNTSSSSSSASTASAPAPGASTWSQPGHKRLFQIREGAMISGVCVGLSEFVHIDVTLIRILFVVFALVTSGWGMLAYGVLMFVVPKVDTRAAASDGVTTGTTPPHHWPWDDGWPWDKHGWPWDHHPWPWEQPSTASQPQPPPGAQAQPAGQAQPAAQQAPSADPRQEWRDKRQEWRDKREDWRAQRREWKAQRRATHQWPYGPGPIGGTAMMIVFLMIGFFWLSFWTGGHFFFGFPFFWGFPHWIGIVFFFMVVRLIFMPFRASRWYGYGGPYGPYSHPHHAWASMWNGFAWFVVMIFAVWFAYRYIPEVHEMFRSFQTSWSDGNFHV